MTPSLPALAGFSRRIDRWIDPERRPSSGADLRRARIVVVEGWLAIASYAALTTTLVLGAAPALPLAQVALSFAATLAALALVRWGGRIEPAAWILTLGLALTPVFQASVDLGIRDPALAFVMLAPLAGAMTSGARLALVGAGVGIVGTCVLFGLDSAGLAPSPFSTAADAAAYAVVMVVVGSALTAVTGVLYVQQTRQRIDQVEGESTRLDAALRASEQRYRSLFDHLPVGMYRTAADGRILLANPALARLIGAAGPESARAFNAADLYADPADRDRFRETILRDGAVRGFEVEWRRPDGGARHVRLDARVALDADGRPLFYEGAVEDVTAEREARHALHRSEARFRALVQRSSDVVVVADRADRLTYVSPTVEALLGHAPDGVLGEPLAALVHPDDLGVIDAFLAEARAGASAPGVELRLRHADGHDVFVDGAATVLYDDPAVAGLVLNLRDVTERKRAQAVLVRAKHQAEEVAALKSTFIANMSHEIRTPLTAILGFADVLGEEVEDPVQSEFVDLIAKSGRRLMDTLNSVLDLARIDAGADLARDPLDAGALADEVATMFGPAAGERGLTIRAEVAPGDHRVVADEAALVRVLHNLVGNAIKFTDEGSVTVAVRSVSGEGGRRVVLTVSDTGIGVDPAFLPRMFGEFEQESSGSGRRYEGAGLGLALSHQLVEQMEGTITVESEKGVGTTFSVSFPSADAAADADGRPLVLVVDDNEQARRVAVHMLSDAFRIATADDGASALAALEAERPDLAVLDIHLGLSISGEDVMRQLRASNAFAALPMVAVTAYGLPGDRERFLAAGFDAYLQKPYSRSDLHATVRHALRLRGVLDEEPEAAEPEAAEPEAAEPEAAEPEAAEPEAAEVEPQTAPEPDESDEPETEAAVSEPAEAASEPEGPSGEGSASATTSPLPRERDRVRGPRVPDGRHARSRRPPSPLKRWRGDPTPTTKRFLSPPSPSRQSPRPPNPSRLSPSPPRPSPSPPRPRPRRAAAPSSRARAARPRPSRSRRAPRPRAPPAPSRRNREGEPGCDRASPRVTMRLAIVGAGPAGLAAAYALRDADVETVAFEKSRGVGGRAATRWRDVPAPDGPARWRFDHGAQYASPEPGSPSARLLRDVLGDALVEVEGAVWPFDDDGTLRPDRARDPGLRWTTADGIAEVGRQLAAATPGLDLRLQTRVAGLDREPGHAARATWAVVTDDGARHPGFDAVLLTAPAPQSAEVLRASGEPALADALDEVTYRSQFAVVWAFDHEVERPADVYALVNADERRQRGGGHDVAWLAVESDKPGRAPEGRSILLAQMSDAWTEAHYHDAQPDVVSRAADAVAGLWGGLPAPLWTDTQRWRYSLPNAAVDADALDAAEARGLFVAGDATAGEGRVHLALEEGLAAAERVRQRGGAARRG